MGNNTRNNRNGGAMTSKPVIHWDLTVRIRDKSQLKKLVKHCLRWNYSFSHKYENSGWEKTTIFTIHDCCWGTNLKFIARILEKEEKDE